MARRKRRRGEKRNAIERPADTTGPSPHANTAEAPPSRPTLHANPPRKNLPLLVVSAVMTLGWIAFLVAMAAGLHEKMIEDSVRIHGLTVPVRATVHTVGGLSAHGDQDDLARWYETMSNRPPVYLVHGEPESQRDFAKYLHRRCGADVHVPVPGTVLDLAGL